MVLKITKKPVETVETYAEINVSNISDFAAEIVAIGEMQDQVATIEGVIAKKFAKELEQKDELLKEIGKRLKKLREQVNEEFKEKDPDSEYTENAGTHALVVGKAGNQRKVTDMKLLQDLMADDDVFYALIKMDLKDIDSYLTPPERELVLETTRTARPIAITQVVRVKV